MPRTRSFNSLRNKMTPKMREEADMKTQELLLHMPLQELRNALALTQVQVAQTLNMSQTSVSKMESQTDMYVSTLRRFIAAMGGELHVVASFPQGDVEISQFSQLEADKKVAA